MLEVLGPDRFRLLGRSNDLVNIAGKRSSLSHLNFHLNAIDGVRRRRVLAARRTRPTPPASSAWWRSSSRPGWRASRSWRRCASRVDAAFLPRRIVPVEALPREPTGKLTAARLAELAAAHGAGGDRR